MYFNLEQLLYLPNTDSPLFLAPGYVCSAIMKMQQKGGAYKNRNSAARELAQQGRAMAAFLEDPPRSVPTLA